MLRLMEKFNKGFVRVDDIEEKDIYLGQIWRSLIYCDHFIKNLYFKDHTRDYVRRACDYVENSAKYLLKKVEPNSKTQNPLGMVINMLKNKKYNLPRNLLDVCENFNKLVYTKAKHKYDLPPQQHLYTVDEALLIYFIAKKLGGSYKVWL